MIKAEKPDLKPLEKIVDDYVAFVSSDDYHEESDYKQYIFEAAVEAFYGTGFWQFLKGR